VVFIFHVSLLVMPGQSRFCRLDIKFFFRY